MRAKSKASGLSKQQEGLTLIETGRLPGRDGGPVLILNFVHRGQV